MAALGKANAAGGTVSAWSPGLRIFPDYDLLTGTKIPPVTPNILDVRIVRQQVQADFPSAGQHSGDLSGGFASAVRRDSAAVEGDVANRRRRREIHQNLKTSPIFLHALKDLAFLKDLSKNS